MSTTTIEEPHTKGRTRLAPRWNVILLDDDDHTYEYVVEMLGAVFGHPISMAFKMAVEVDSTGCVIIWTGAKEVAELKQEQVHAYGPDHRMPQCAGSMTAILEPVE